MIFTDEELQAFKAKHGKIFLMTIEDKSCVLKNPDRAVLGYASKIQADSGDPMKFNEALLENCWVAGDEEIKTDDAYFFAASGQLDKLLSFKVAELKEV